MIRTGLFRYARHADIEHLLGMGWMPVADLGSTHGQWSHLLWACDCPTFRLLAGLSS
jgi:hypothetical protein